VAYWASLSSGDFVSLSDYASLEAAGGGGLDLRIGAIRDIALRDAVGDAVRGAAVLARFRIHELERAGAPPLHLVLLAAGSDFELRLYRVPPAWRSGSRDQLVDWGQTWFFLPPSDPEDFISADLELAPFPDLPDVQGGGATDLVWAMSGFGQPVYGSWQGGGGEVPVILAEYEAEVPEGLAVADPLALYLEENWMRRDGTVLPEGGLVTAMVGRRLGPSDVEAFKA
jgi:hypothetical protein